MPSSRVTSTTFFADRAHIRLPTHPVATVAIARGHSLAHKPSYLYWEQSIAREVVSIVGLDKSRTRAAILFPAYDRNTKHNGVVYRVWCPTITQEIRDARRLLEHEHPEGVNNAGTLVCIGAAQGRTNSRIIGVALIGEILHTNLLERHVFAEPVLGSSWLSRVKDGKLSRGEIIRRLHLTAGKRFVIRKECRGRGLGTVLAKHVAVVAAAFRWPPADVIEVSRRMPERDLYALCGRQQRDFLTCSGYVPLPSWRWSARQGKTRDERTTIATSSRIIPGYYYKTVAEFRYRERALANATSAVR